MAAIRSRNTKPEVRVRRVLHAMGLRFRCIEGLPGRRISCCRSERTSFVHGCFWPVTCNMGRYVGSGELGRKARRQGGSLIRRHARALRRWAALLRVWEW